MGGSAFVGGNVGSSRGKSIQRSAGGGYCFLSWLAYRDGWLGRKQSLSYEPDLFGSVMRPWQPSYSFHRSDIPLFAGLYEAP